MKLLWLSNMTPGAVHELEGNGSGGGLWLDHVLSDIRKTTNDSLHILFPGSPRSGRLDDRCEYAAFDEMLEHVYYPELESLFLEHLREFNPDVIHIWGTEYGHTLAMVRAAKQLGLADRIVISVQGLCGAISSHYTEGVPEKVCRRYSFRDFIRRDNLRGQQRKFVLRGSMEREALQSVGHVIGRTEWDKAVTGQINPNRKYHFCSETLRENFYHDTWQYSACSKHTIFASTCSYPVKGFHYLLEAFRIVLARYPDARIRVTGESFFPQNLESRIRQQYYFRYLERYCKQYGLQDKIDFLGSLNAEQMKAAYLDANVFVLPSTVENSPNSLGEAMLLGVPSVASDVGGVSDLLYRGEGFVYQTAAPYMLAHYIMEVFAMEKEAEQMGHRAQAHARQTHDPEKNLADLLAIYREVYEGTEKAK